MSTLVLGGTGTVGSEVVRHLLARGSGDISVLTRDRNKLSDLPQGVKGVTGDLTDPTTLDGVFEGVTRMFLLNPVAMTELHEGLTALEEARRAEVGKIVYLSVQNPESGAHIPHFASKIAMERAIRESGIPHVILQPNNFFQNDFWLKDAIVDHGMYPQPLGDVGVRRVDVRDVGAAAAAALLTSDFDGEALPLVGPDVLSGAACAQAWSAALGREINYAGHDLPAWEAQARQMLPPWMAWDFRIMYRMFLEGGFEGNEADLAATRRILGAEPRSFEAFTREVAGMWS